MRKIRAMVVILTGMMVSACTKNAHEVWVAKKDTSVYESESDTEQRILFTLAIGDACTPLRSVVMKAYLHTEIQCKSGRRRFEG